ncbi:hypothetical protein GQ457_02G022640 [Hibiscus cannabinus]
MSQLEKTGPALADYLGWDQILAERLAELMAYGVKGKPSIHVHTPQYSPLWEYLSEGPQRKNSSKKWEAILRDLRSEDIIWRVYWLDHTYILYRCGVTKIRKKILEIANAWLYPYQAKFAALNLTLDYQIWRTKRKNYKIPSPSRGKALTLEEQFKVVPTEVEIVRQECEEEKRALNKRIVELEARNQELDHVVTYYQGHSDMFENELNRVNVDFKDLQEEWEAELRDRENDTKRYMKMLCAKEKQNSAAKLESAQHENETLKELVVELKDSLQQHKDLIDEIQDSMKMNNAIGTSNFSLQEGTSR